MYSSTLLGYRGSYSSAKFDDLATKQEKSKWKVTSLTLLRAQGDQGKVKEDAGLFFVSKLMTV